MDVTVICRPQPSWFHFWRKLGEKMCQTGVLLTDLPTAERCPSGHTKEQHSGTARHSVAWRGTAQPGAATVPWAQAPSSCPARAGGFCTEQHKSPPRVTAAPLGKRSPVNAPFTRSHSRAATCCQGPQSPTSWSPLSLAMVPRVPCPSPGGPACRGVLLLLCPIEQMKQPVLLVLPANSNFHSTFEDKRSSTSTSVAAAPTCSRLQPASSLPALPQPRNSFIFCLSPPVTSTHPSDLTALSHALELLCKLG